MLILLMSVVIILIVAIITNKRPAHNDSTVLEKSGGDGFDSWNLPPHLSPEEKAWLKEVADYYGIRYVTGIETKKYILHSLNNDFAAMPGWDMWDASIHDAPGQFERAERAGTDQSISILCYDPKYQLAKVQGKTGIYLTSSKRCSCPDFRKRRLPCKHMYALAFNLNGEIEKEIVDHIHKPLYGLKLALAGHLPKSSKGSGGIRAYISDFGGEWSDNIDEFESSAVVVGRDPSINKLERIKKLDIEILDPEVILDIFTQHN